MGAYQAADTAGHARRRQTPRDMREVVNGVMDIFGNGCQWRYIPNNLPPRSMMNDDFRLWSDKGAPEKIRHALYINCREQVEQKASPTACIIDSQSVKSAEKGRPASIRMGSMPVS